MNTSLNLSFKTILKIFSVKNVIEGISLLLFIFYVFSLNIDGCLLILINSMITAKLISYLNASLDSYQFTSVFFKKLKCYIQILNYIFNYLTIKGIWPVISLIYFFIISWSLFSYTYRFSFYYYFNLYKLYKYKI